MVRGIDVDDLTVRVHRHRAQDREATAERGELRRDMKFAKRAAVPATGTSGERWPAADTTETASVMDRRLGAETFTGDGIGRAPQLQRRPGATRRDVTPPSQVICHRSPDLDRFETTETPLRPDRPQIEVHRSRATGAHSRRCAGQIHGIPALAGSTVEA